MTEDYPYNNFINKQSFFWMPDYLDVSSWIEHIPFAFWIIETCKPKIMVELGVHNGTSYFAFCQAIKTLNLNTTSFAVDTWKGDEHAGFYDDAVFNKVAEYNSQKYSRFSTLIRSTFDEAKNYFIDESIDLLHIDGLHTYEAIKLDFETWYPKLSPNAIVVFHDINVRERNFGVFKLWEELKIKFRNFQFNFGHGLGIIVLGNLTTNELNNLCDNNNANEDYIFLRNLFSDRGCLLKNQLFTSILLNNERTNLVKKDSVINELNKLNETLLANIEKNNILQNKERESHILLISKEQSSLSSGYKLIENENEYLKSKSILLEEENDFLKKDFSSLQIENDILKSKLQNLENLVGFHENDYQILVNENNLNRESSFDTENNLQIIIQKLQKALYWYIETYENRSLIGVVKEKFKHLSKKKILTNQHNNEIIIANNPQQIHNDNTDLINLSAVKFKINKFTLYPIHDISTSENKNQFSSTGFDPYFIVDFKTNPTKAGWYFLLITIKEVDDKKLTPKLYCDYGQGFNEKDIIILSNVKNDKSETLLNFSSTVYKLRFDPARIECNFILSQFKLLPLSKIKALKIALSKFRHIHYPHQSNLTYYKLLMLNVLRSDNKELRKRIRESLINIEVRPEDGYREWYKVYDTITSTELINIRSYSKKFLYTPLFSIIMPVYNAPIIFLKIAIESIINQAYQNWELCIADDLSTDEEVKILLKEYEEKDKRIKVVYRETNGHISAASNSAIDIAVGDFIVLVDQDDELPLHCLYMVALAINENKNAHILYSDEDKMDENGIRFGPYFKTDWNADLFYGQNMISHLGVYKLSLIKKVGGFRIGYEGSQDYDLALRCIEHLNPDQIHHIPHVLYHWRAIKGSTALANSNKSYAADAGFRALQDHLHRTGDLGIALENTHNSYRVKWKLPEIIPLVSIIIPTKDKLEILSACIESILKKTAYTNYEILIIDNNSTEQITHDYYYKIQQEHKRVKVYYYKKEFNFSAIINYGVQQSKGEILALLNNDTSVINEDWLTEMVSQCLRKGAGAVGAKLYYPNGQIQHAGIFLSDGHPGIHIYLKKEGEDSGYFNKLNLVQNYLAVTAACLVVKKEIFLKANGFDEENLKITYNDVDFCLKLVKLGYRNIWTPFAQLIHFDSLSRGSDFDPMNYSRFKKEHSFILKKWQHYIKNDPYFNHNLGIETLSHTYAFPPKRKYEWQTGKAQIYKSIVKI